MKENIEEDIKIVEKLIKTMEQDRITFKDEQSKEIYAYFITALEHILSDYKRVLKENEELKHKYDVFVKMSSDVIANSIPTQKIEDKIEEYKRDVINLDTYPNFSEQELHREIIDILQDILEERGE